MGKAVRIHADFTRVGELTIIISGLGRYAEVSKTGSTTLTSQLCLALPSVRLIIYLKSSPYDT